MAQGFLGSGMSCGRRSSHSVYEVVTFLASHLFPYWARVWLSNIASFGRRDVRSVGEFFKSSIEESGEPSPAHSAPEIVFESESNPGDCREQFP